MTSFRVASFNILAPCWVDQAPEYYAGHTELLCPVARLDKVGLVIRDYDVAFLQEVQQFDAVVEKFGDEFHVVSGLHGELLWAPLKGERHGNAILVRKSLCASSDVVPTQVELTSDGNNALVARCRLGQEGSWITLVNLHLECDDDVECITGSDFAKRREEQIHAALAALVQDEGPIILAGDMNAPLRTPELLPLRAAGFTDLTSAHIERTEFDFNEHVYSDPIDAILVRGIAEVDAEVHSFARPHYNALTEEKIAFLLRHYGSDHVPVGVTVTFTVPDDAFLAPPSPSVMQLEEVD